MRRAGNIVRFTVKNNVNTLCKWPTDDSSGVPITSTRVPITLNGLIHSNRQFDRNIRDYAYIRFNYIAFKVTDVAHIGVSTLATVPGSDPPAYLTPGVQAFLGSIPVNVNWDVEQDFSFTKGTEGVVDPEGFAAHPGTKQIRPGQKRPISFVWHFPSSFRVWLKTDNVKNASSLSSPISTFMQNVAGLFSLRAPGNVWYSVPKFWGDMLPAVTGTGAAVRTYIRSNYYLGVSFRGRRLMDDGTCSIGTCSYFNEPFLPETTDEMKDERSTAAE